MAMKSGKQRPKAAGATPKKRKVISGEARAAYGEIRQGVKSLEKSITEIQRDVLKAEKKIEAEARVRIRDLRQEARAQLNVLKSKRRDAARVLKRVSTAAGQSWEDIKQSADAIIADARATATSVIDRFRSALGR